ncbi:GNAT family N-acetyltransferase [Salipiger mangrovisoli]|uniref:GNAT family N-acetyltransferase n=1 Tax=Salipiger mangrovisoli TaxID=2865933 RepID=A0ABR9WX18_9RHOB|nr:GNAT family N-acetyltransferase [Salipiger mangrovisoli]MBE9635834.1 GNAT family N-acetyltransferase [Salipiger mangrovisoli]
MPDPAAATIRAANRADVPGLSAMLQDLVAAGKRTRPADEAFVLATYVAHPNGISCFVAEAADGQLLGLQALSRAMAGNPYGTPEGWGIIGTHVAPAAARRGIGKGLFAATRAAAGAADLPAIEACIGASNAEGQGYYAAMGFRSWRSPEGSVCKRYDLGD